MPQIFRIGPYSIYFWSNEKVIIFKHEKPRQCHGFSEFFYFLRFSYFSAASFCPIGFYLNGDAPKMDLKIST